MWFNLDRAVSHNLLQYACLYILCVLIFTCTYICCNSTYLLKYSLQIYRKGIVVFIRSSKVWFKTTSCAKGPFTRRIFPGNFQRNSILLSKGGSSRYSDRFITRKYDVTMAAVCATERRWREHLGGSAGMLTQRNFKI